MARYAWSASLVWLGTVVLAASACGEDDPAEEHVLATEYDQTCTTAADCVLVAELTKKGTSCSLSCPRGPLNKADRERFDAALSRERAGCASMSQPSCIALGDPTCEAGKCTAPPPP